MLRLMLCINDFLNEFLIFYYTLFLNMMCNANKIIVRDHYFSTWFYSQ